LSIKSQAEYRLSTVKHTVRGHYVCSSGAVCSIVSSPLRKSLYIIQHVALHPLSKFTDSMSGFHFKLNTPYIKLTLTIVTTLFGFETLATRISFDVENNKFGYAEKTGKIQ
jgi:hypothetical protein